MNYHHHFHAGSFADIFKHAVLTLLIQSLLGKEKSFYYLDTHAGIGLYDLKHADAQKTQEYNNGLRPLLQAKNLPALLKPYIDAIATCNSESAITTMPRYYPGSPWLVNYLLRPQDRMQLIELHSDDMRLLKQLFHKNNQVIVQQMDGYQAIKALLPPKERRGLVLIDPPYEQADEFTTIIAAVCEGLKRWDTGIYAVWYPIKDKAIIDRFLNKLKAATNKELLVAELNIYSIDVKLSLNGSGMAIINPPWQLDAKLKELLPWLWQVLSPEKQGNYKVMNW